VAQIDVGNGKLGGWHLKRLRALPNRLNKSHSLKAAIPEMG
jgi:hypothetical protein